MIIQVDFTEQVRSKVQIRLTKAQVEAAYAQAGVTDDSKPVERQHALFVWLTTSVVKADFECDLWFGMVEDQHPNWVVGESAVPDLNIAIDVHERQLDAVDIIKEEL